MIHYDGKKMIFQKLHQKILNVFILVISFLTITFEKMVFTKYTFEKANSFATASAALHTKTVNFFKLKKPKQL